MTDDLAAEIQVLFAEARHRRRRRRLVAGAASLALAAAITGAWLARPGHRARPAPDRDHMVAAARVVRFALPPAHVAWVDYHGRLHLGNVATLAQNIAGTVPAWAGAGWLVQAGGRIYGADSPVIREFNPAAGRTLRIARGAGVFPSAGGRHAYVELTATSLIELRASGRGVLRRLRTPAGWSLPQEAAGEVPDAAAGSIVVSTKEPGGSSRQPVIGVWNTRDGRVRVLGRGYVVAGPATPRGTDSSLVAWTRCPPGGCPLEITSIPSMRTVTVRSPLPYGFAQGAAFSPDGSRLAAFERTASPSTPCCANSSVLVIVNTRTGMVRPVRAARLQTQEDAGWILWLPGGSRLLAGALGYSYAVDTATYQARPFFFYPQKTGGAAADHNIMDTPDINFSAVLLPPGTANPARPAIRKIR